MNTIKDINSFAQAISGNFKGLNKKVKAGKKKSQDTAINNVFGNTQFSNMQMETHQKARSNIRLPPCSLKFALACSDPFDPACRGACIPISAAPTQKVHAFARFDITIGSAGVGWALITPSLANDAFCIAVTIPGYTGTTANAYSANNILLPGVTGVNHNGPYGAAEMKTVDNQTYAGGRIVSAGVRLQYTGTVNNMSGLFYCLQEPDHNSLSGCSLSDISRFETVDIHAVSREPCTLVCFPNDEQETQIKSSRAASSNVVYPYATTDLWSTTYNGGTSYTYLAAGVNVGHPVGLVFITGKAGETVHGEYITHMEYNGTLPAALTTAVDSDAANTFRIITAAKTITSKKLDHPKLSNWQAMYQSLGEVAASAIPMMVPAAQSALSALL